jgi:phosphoribosylformylglycinamidine synthase subunit PurL
MVGLIDDTRKIITQGFKNEGDVIALLGEGSGGLSVSEYARAVLGIKTNQMIAEGRLPSIDLAAERRLQDALLAMADEMLLNSAHDCSEGGLAVTIAESCFSSLGRDGIGATIDLEANGLSNAELLFGESPSRIVISFAGENEARVREMAGDVPFAVIGKVGDDVVRISVDGTEQISGTVIELETIWESALALKLIS